MKRFEQVGREVSAMVDPEARRGKMLPIDQETATRRIMLGRAFFEERAGKTVAFCTFDEMSECVEIRSVVTDEAFRRQGLATVVASKVVLGAQKVADKPIVALCNGESQWLMRKLGLRSAQKMVGFPELWQECQSCAEYGHWPECHCRYMCLFGRMYENRGHSFSVIDLAQAEEGDFKGAARLYCEVWQEPPWNETSWQADEVERDFRGNLAKDRGLALLAICHGRIIGFTSGWQIEPEAIAERTDGKLGAGDFGGQSVFYVAELAVDRQYRGAGIGKQLSRDLMAKAKAGGAQRFLLRTNLNATAARTLYRDLGFSESQAADVTFVDRTYWVL